MLAKYFSIIRNYVLSVSSQRKYKFYHQNTLLDAFRTNSRNTIGRNPRMVIPLLANQDLAPMLTTYNLCMIHTCGGVADSVIFGGHNLHKSHGACHLYHSVNHPTYIFSYWKEVQ